MSPERTTFLKTLRGDDKNFGSSSYDIKLAKNESAVGRVWAGSSAETIDRPADDEQFAHQQLAKDFNITKICFRAFAGDVLEWGFGPTCKAVVEWKLAKEFTPTEHYVTPERTTFLKTLRGDHGSKTTNWESSEDDCHA